MARAFYNHLKNLGFNKVSVDMTDESWGNMTNILLQLEAEGLIEVEQSNNPDFVRIRLLK